VFKLGPRVRSMGWLATMSPPMMTSLKWEDYGLCYSGTYLSYRLRNTRKSYGWLMGPDRFMESGPQEI